MKELVCGLNFSPKLGLDRINTRLERLNKALGRQIKSLKTLIQGVGGRSDRSEREKVNAEVVNFGRIWQNSA